MKVWQLLKKLTRVQPKLYFLDAVLTILSWVLLTIPAFVSQRFFDSLAGQSTTGFNIWSLIAILVAAQLARIAIILFNITIDVTFRNLIGTVLRKNMLDNALKGHLKQALVAGDAISRFREDVDDVTDFLSWSSLLDVIGAMVFAVIAVTMMIRINLLITIIVFIPLALVVLIADKAGKRIDRLRKQSRLATGAVTNFIGEIFGAVQAIQISNNEPHVINHFDQLNKERGKKIISENVFTSLLNSVFTNIAEIGTGIILLLVAGSMKSGAFTVGGLAVFTYYLNWVIQLLKRFGAITARYKQLGVSFRRMSDLAATGQAQELARRRDEPSTCSEAKTIEPCSQPLSEVEICNLTYRYPGSGRGIFYISFRLPRGSVTVITGAAGSGKSTLLKCILGVLPVQSGEIYWNGEAVSDPSSFFVPSRSGYSPQIPRLFSETLKNNILLGLDEKAVDLDQAIHLAVMEEDVKQLTKGIDTIIGPRGVMLSGGQVLRTAAARMVVRKPELLIIDDLSSALDPNTERLLWERILADKGKVTSLIVSNHPEAIRHADNVIVLQDGKISASGTLDELLSYCKEIQQLCAVAT